MIATPPTADEINANRRKVVRALKRSKRQGFGQLFKGCVPCALGVAARTLLGIHHEKQVEAYGDGAVYDDLEILLGETGHGLNAIWRLNDRDEYSLPRIGELCAVRWGIQ